MATRKKVPVQVRVRKLTFNSEGQDVEVFEARIPGYEFRSVQRSEDEAITRVMELVTTERQRRR